MRALELSKRKEHYASLLTPHSCDELKLELVKHAIELKELEALPSHISADLISRAKLAFSKEAQPSSSFVAISTSAPLEVMEKQRKQ